MWKFLTAFALFLPFEAAAELSILVMQVLPATCGNANGQAYVMVVGGVPPYNYSWSNGAGTADLINVSPGSYTLTVTDNVGTIATQGVVVPNSPVLPYNEGGTYLVPDGQGGEMWGGACAGQCNGRIAMPLALFGGTAPYTINWNASSTIVPDGITAEGLPVYANFCLGDNVTYTYTDATGCSGAGSFTVIGVEAEAVPSIAGVQGACGGGANGRVLIDCPAWNWVEPSMEIYRNGNLVSQVSYPQTPQTVQVQGLIAGDYEVRLNWMGACPTVLPFTIPALSVPCGTVSGTNFLDNDQDCQPDAGEVRMPYQVLNIQPVNDWVLTSGNGDFAFALPNGSYTLAHVNPNTVPLCPAQQPVPFTVNNNATVIMLADSSTLPLDIATFGTATAARPGFNTSQYITLRNLSAKLSGDVEVVLTHDAALTFLSATPAPTSVVGNTITWELPELTAFAERTIAMEYNVPVSTPLGTLLISTVSGTCALTDNDLSNNGATIERVVTGSYDPNDKRARTSTGWSDQLYLIDQDTWIDYTIRFQNTGTDTAFTVVITDTLAAELDMATFQQGTASHSFEVVFKPGRVIEWTFPNILLPDSNVNEPRSHGLVHFRIRPQLPVLPGTVIANVANIYFDFNPPIITEPSVLVAEFSTGVGGRQSSAMTLSPVPASDRLSITGTDAIERLTVLSADGRVVLRANFRAMSGTLDLHRLSRGAYLLIAEMDDGAIMHERFVKQ